MSWRKCVLRYWRFHCDERTLAICTPLISLWVSFGGLWFETLTYEWGWRVYCWPRFFFVPEGESVSRYRFEKIHHRVTPELVVDSGLSADKLIQGYRQ